MKFKTILLNRLLYTENGLYVAHLGVTISHKLTRFLQPMSPKIILFYKTVSKPYLFHLSFSKNFTNIKNAKTGHKTKAVIQEGSNASKKKLATSGISKKLNLTLHQHVFTIVKKDNFINCIHSLYPTSTEIPTVDTSIKLHIIKLL